MSLDHLIYRRSPLHLRDRFSRLKTKVKDKAIRHNITLFVHENITSNGTSTHGHRHRFHDLKDSFKNKTHYDAIKQSIKTKIDDKFDLHHNKTYPKGFYDSIFSPETENEVYLKTIVICLWALALICIIPTIIIIFLPGKKKTTTSANMIFFHVFVCELCYILYVFLAIVNVARDFRLGPTLCDVGNYGMYVTIPIMQFALLFLSFERLSNHFNFDTACFKIFKKPYIIQAILCSIWVVFVGILGTVLFIKKQFSFNVVKDTVLNLAPPLLGDVASKLASRRHHCSIDGRLSSVFKTLIIILFVVLIIKPIGFSLGFNLLSPFFCKDKQKTTPRNFERRTTILVTIFLVLNLFFSFPFYFISMFNSILTRIDATRDTFALVLKICFILRITNIIFECLAFYIFERNSWGCLSKMLYYITCKKFPILAAESDDDKYFTKDKEMNLLLNGELSPDDAAKEDTIEIEDDDDNEAKKNTKKSLKKKSKKDKSPIASDQDEKVKLTKVDVKRKLDRRKTDSEDEESDDKTMKIDKRKAKTKKTKSDDEKSDQKPQRKGTESDDEDDTDEEKPKSQPKKRDTVKIVNETKLTPSKSRRSTGNTSDVDVRIPNGKSTAHRSSSVRTSTKTAQPVRRNLSSATNTPKHRSTPPLISSNKSESDANSSASEAPSVVYNISSGSTNKRPTHLTPKEPDRKRTSSEESRSRHRHRTASSPSTRRIANGSATKSRSKRRNSIDAATNTSPQAKTKRKTPNGTHANGHKKKHKVGSRTRILEMSEV